MSKSRLEAFSDGVIAILITIMVLELPTPEGTTWEVLREDLPVLLAYALLVVPRRMSSGQRTTGSQPRRYLPDWRSSHSMPSLSRWASRPPLLMPAMSATPRRVPTETTN